MSNLLYFTLAYNGGMTNVPYFLLAYKGGMWTMSYVALVCCQMCRILRWPIRVGCQICRILRWPMRVGRQMCRVLRWLQKSIKWVPGSPIEALSSIASRSRQNEFQAFVLGIFWHSRSRRNESQEVRFKHFVASALEVDKRIYRRLGLSMFWPLLSRSRQNFVQGFDLNIFCVWL